MELLKTKPKAVQVLTFGDVKTPEKKEDDNYMSFGTQFRELGEENLALPIVQDSLTDSKGWVRFGNNNLFPQDVNQMYYTSPINGAIINFKTNAAVGGGYSIIPKTNTAKDKVAAMVFERRHKIDKLLSPATKDGIMHESIYLLLTFSEDKKFRSVKRIPREWVRNTQDKKLYFVCENWAHQTNIRPIRKFNGVGYDSEMLLCWENQSVGMDTYSIASYTSALNWCELDGKMSLFHKNNILNSIFPSFVLLFPKKPTGDKEKLELKKTIEGAKGAKNAGKVVALFANKPEQMPKIEAIPVNQNDKLFEQTDERIDAQVCKAHCIDPLLLGIRVSGKLGSGNDLKQSYIIFEKNTIIPLRRVIESLFNELLSVAGVNATFKINEYQIINETIVEVGDENSKVLDAINSLDPMVANKVLESMSSDQVLRLVGLKTETLTPE